MIEKKKKNKIDKKNTKPEFLSKDKQSTIIPLNTKGSKNLEKLKRLNESIEHARGPKKIELIRKRAVLLSNLSSEEYKEHLKTVETYFQIKKKLLQFMFPYVIEYNKIQSKFTTTRYYNNINLVVPFIYDFHRITSRYEVLKYYPFELQHKEEKDFLFRNDHHSGKGLPPQRLKSRFYIYKTFYHSLQELLYKQKKYHAAVLEKVNPEITSNMVVQYDKFRYYRYPTYLWNIIFQDPIIEKFINLFIKHGKKEKAENIFISLFLHFHNYMFMNPLFMFKTAIENVRPYVCSKSIPFGRRTKVVPHPINEKQQIKLAMKWIKHEALSIRNNIPVHFKLMDAITNAFYKRGYAYNQMISLHTDAYSQRAYMYSNYYLRSSKVKNKRPF